VNVCYLALFHGGGNLDIRWHIAGVNPNGKINLTCAVRLFVKWLVA